ncbi:hypothetical protein [Qingshengfaniella alkalisoli]|uniref:Acyloxyacyl hydrolase n=1 Tax=Qingshengfaniella alkalisoli TaxID=2599296 RepID=A0A5B8IVX8_9RHOB|nr:hypothetical protein [Qingshengfaniella alkalisoli]QDY69784.1 hypothetical protein FPZ52_09230 [Qingshengfaniella alkalisoli]
MTAAVLAAALVLSDPVKAQEATGYWSLSVGRMTDNEWGEVAEQPGSISWRDAQLSGVALSREWGLGRWGFVGVEGQLLKHFGEQDHIEVSVPVFYRTPRTDQVFIPSLAYGLGLSYATEPPVSEIERTGESTELLAHWFLEMEFGARASDWRPYIRLHHRSHAWETFDARTGSNAVLFGVRAAF